ncbi:ABC transporter permease [Duganella sp. BuS-21]|uniref:ABC transporter permease n=1 Tax=Duganella sp. BuS-21 TaxID=2943848 RepID=UPI0035A5B0F3
MNWLRTLLVKLLGALAVMLGAASLAFAAISLTGGDTALAILGGEDAQPSPQAIAQVRIDYGLDQPLPVQYLHYVGRLLQGDLGTSYRLNTPVTELIWQQLGYTVTLSLTAAGVSVLLAVTLATLTAGRGRSRNRLRQTVSGFELILTSAPGFVLGLLLLLLFSFRLHWLPASGSDGWRALVLPALTLALPMTPWLAQILRQELDDILEQPFIAMARARGMGEAAVRLRHALRHALVSLVTLSGFILGTLLAGTAVVETLFARRGIGRLMVDATAGKDIPLVLGITLLSAFLYAVVHILVDASYVLIDPRLRRPNTSNA